MRLMTIHRKEHLPYEQIVEKSVEIFAFPDRVWSVLTDAENIAQWMNGAQVESKWETGSDITFTGTMPNFNKPYRDRGTVLAVEPEKLLQYSLWSEMARRTDTPENRTIVTLMLDRLEERTLLTVRHENFQSEVEYKHANFFWTVALHMIKNLLEK